MIIFLYLEWVTCVCIPSNFGLILYVVNVIMWKLDFSTFL